MSYSTRRPQIVLPNNTLFVPNALDHFFGGNVFDPAAVNANRGIFYQFSAPYDTAVQSISVWCAAGTTQNFDLGLYDGAGVRLGSLGSTGIASTTGLKTWTPTTPISVAADTTYIAAFACDSATPTFVSVFGLSGQISSGLTFAASQMPLPATWSAQTVWNAASRVPLLKIVFSS